MGYFYNDIAGVPAQDNPRYSLGAFRYDDVAGWGFGAVGIGFFAIAWVFSSLKGRV